MKRNKNNTDLKHNSTSFLRGAGNLGAGNIVFETFEPRVLMDASVPLSPLNTNSIGAVLASDSHPAIVQNASGTQISVSINGNGHWQLIQQATAPSLMITGTDTNSQILISESGGNNQFLLAGIDLEGPAASLIGNGINLDGSLVLKGTVGSLAIGTLTVDANSSTSLTGTSPATTAAITVGDTTPVALSLSAGATLSTQTAIVGNQAGAAGSTASVSGSSSLWQVSGSLTLGNAAPSTQLTISNSGEVIADTLDVGAQSGSSGTVTISGSGSELAVSGEAILGDQGSATLSIESGASAILGDAIFGSMAGSSAQVTLSGTGSTLYVPGTLTLGGAGTAVLTLGAGTSLDVGSLNIGPGGLLKSSASLSAFSAGTAPVLTAGLASFASGTAINGATSNPTVTGTVSASNSLVSLRAGLGTAPISAYTDITANIASGSFTISKAQLTALNGGTLPDGRYVLTLVATDRQGLQTLTNITINLQTVAPTITSFGLSQSSATGGSGNVTASALVALTGTATPGATISLSGGGLATPIQTVVGGNGVFQFANVAVSAGVNAFTATATNGVGLTATSQVTVTRQGTQSADVAMQWNAITLNTIAGLALQPPDASRLLAIVSLAMYDTMAAIEGTPSYMVSETVTGPVSEQAALAETAYEVLVSLFPVNKSIYDAALATSLQGIATGTALTAGLALGQSIADTTMALRKNDGSANFVLFDGSSATGSWSPTAPMYTPAVDPQWGSVTPFAISDVASLIAQIGAPPDITSAQWATDLNQVESLGSATSTTRTADQTQIAKFWAGTQGSITPAGIWNLIATTVSQSQGDSLSANVRMFAELNTALADAAIADWDLKYTYDTWRPIQAVPVANSVNSAATSVANWTPLLTTPAFPEYASGHSTLSSAAATVLASIFGDATSFSVSVPYLAGVTRSYTSFSAAAAEAGMSRIYGGIHFMFSNTAGQALGALVGKQVIARFAQSSDTQPPQVVANDTAANSAKNITLTGQIVDNLSGVASATVSVDGGKTVALKLDAKGDFSFTTSFLLNGTNDGTHTISIVATDNAGNIASAFTRSFVLDTVAPVVSLPSLSNGDALTSTTRLTGTVSGTGSAIVALGYTIDGGVVNPMAFSGGAFDVALPIANLAVGTHSIVITAQDAAGNVTTLTRSVTVASLAAFTIASITPTDGQTDVGVTYRPKITFSRAVNAATLTSTSFYATDTAGNTVAATIAVAQDGSYAFLLFSNALPGLSTITLNVVGSLIRAAADGAYLDAGGTGSTTGSTDTLSFTTVSTTGVAGTIIKGIVADPGPDLVPGTADDLAAGADGVLHTTDDVYKLPIANAKVTVLGTNIVVYTAADGSFEIDNAPSGDVKLSIDGRTATNAPTGFFFPEMVLDLTITPGVVNTPMGSMGSAAAQAANAGILGTYLPRVASSSLTTVSSTGSTMVTTTQSSSPSLTGDQVGALTLNIPAGSALDANGNPVSNVQVGIAAVPAQLVQDMLPAGVTQHSFDITIQAPGVSVFTAPAQITFPNVFGAAPGTKLQVLSFDHTTGQLVIDGTATVSADGKTVTSDPGQGVTTPGWHGLVDTGCTLKGPTPPPPPTCMPPESGTSTFNQIRNTSDAIGQLLDCAAQFNVITKNIATVYKILNDGLQVANDIANLCVKAKEATGACSGPEVINAIIATAKDYKAHLTDIVKTATNALYDAESIADKIFNCVDNILSAVNSACKALSANTECNGLPAWANLACAGVNFVSVEYKLALNTYKLSKDKLTTLLATETACVVSEGISYILEQYISNGCSLTPKNSSSISLSSAASINDYSLNLQSSTTSPTLDDLISQINSIISAWPGNYKNDGNIFDSFSAGINLSNTSALQLAQISLPFISSMIGNPKSGYYLISYNGSEIRGQLDSNGQFSANISANSDFEVKLFDPSTNSIRLAYGHTGASGVAVNITGWVTFEDSATTVSGLSPTAADIVGIDPNKFGNFIPGVSDLVALQNGLANNSFSFQRTNILSSLNLNGIAESVIVTQASATGGALTAFVADGNAGLSVVDVSNPLKPKLLAQLSLNGTSTDVAVDTTTNIAAVASGQAGLNLVDVSNTSSPKLLADLTFPNPVAAVATSGGLAYVAEGTSVAMVDLTTQSVLTTLDLSNSGGTTLTDIQAANGILYTMDAAHTLRTIAVTGNLLTAEGSLSLTLGSGKITIGNGVAYVPAGNGGTGGYQTVDISDPTNLKLISGIGTGNGEAGIAMALNGSGLGIAVGSSNFVFGGYKALDVLNVSDPTNTANFVTRINLPQVPYGVAVANGIAFVADGSGGLQIVNYLSLDTKGVAPTVSINTSAIDADPKTAGVQVVEGSVINVTPTVADDVQVRNVELLVNGVVVANDPSYPFNFSVQVPSIAAGGSTMTIQAEAFDTGGNATLSNLVTLNVIKDTIPPAVVSSNVSNNSSIYYTNSLQFTFSKPLDTSKLSTSAITLVGAGPDGVFGTADDVTVPVTLSTRAFGQVLTLSLATPLSAGNYKLAINASIISDLSGNTLTTPITLAFTILPASDVKALIGNPTITQEPSANPGQLIGISVPFDPSTAHMVFTTIDTSGNQSTVDVAASEWNKTTGKAYFTVPMNAFTGTVNMYSLVGSVKTNFTAGVFPLQIVPVLTGMTVNSVSSDGTSANVTLYGSGFIAGNNSTYSFGTKAIVASSPSSGPSVSNYGYTPNYTYLPNGFVTLTVPLSVAAYGSISVSTAGGSSVPFGATLASITGTALSGTAANVALPSANAGQAVTLTGTGLSTNTSVFFTYTSGNGTPTTVLLHPSAAALNGASATLIVPQYANGIATLSVLGSATQLSLQIVPVLNSAVEYGTDALQIEGSGFVLSSTSLQFGSVAQTAATAREQYTTYNYATNQYYSTDNTQLNITTEATHGFGTLTVTTAGGTSAGYVLNQAQAGDGYLRDVAAASSGSQAWVADNANPEILHLIDTTTGAQIRSLTLTGNLAYPGNGVGLQVTTAAFTLGSTSVPTGSLLVFNGNYNVVSALNATTGAVIASLSLPATHQPVAGLFDPTSGHLFIVDAHGTTSQLVEINPATGAQIAAFNLPVNGHEAGLAVDAAGNFWYGSYNYSTATDSMVYELSRTGVLLRQLALSDQGFGGSVTGLSFDGSGNLLVSSTTGAIYRINTSYDPAQVLPTLTAITALATDGTATNAAVSSANAGQVITLSGTNFNAGTEVVFQTLDSSGNAGTQAVAPLVVSADGKTLQVQVPLLATTGTIQVVNTGSRNLGYSSGGDQAIYRAVTLSFTPSASTETLSFGDGGLQSGMSWGLDNVVVAQGATTVFSDNFESGTPKSAWSAGSVDGSDQGVFSQFLGPFSNANTSLNLTGLTAGKTYTLTFDLYVMGNWNGQTSADNFHVLANGATLLNAAFANGTLTGVQTYNASASLALQIVPTLSGKTGSPGGDATFTLQGSGLMDGATTVSVGGVTLGDAGFTNQSALGVVNGSSNVSLNVTAPLTLDGPITVKTAGGTATLAASWPSQPPVLFSGITATAQAGTATNGALASANVGQSITLVGQGFTNSTLVQFTAVDATGTVGTVTRTGTASSDGTSLVIIVPELAKTGTVHVLGSTASYTLQIVPVLRAVGGTIAAGNTIELDATGLVASELVITIDGKPVGTFAVHNEVDASTSSAAQQLLTLTVPSGIGAGVITLSTLGGNITLHTGVSLATSTQTPASDVGDTIATALAVNPVLDSAVTLSATIGDGSNTTKDVDLYQVTLAAGEQLQAVLNATTSLNLRLFNAAGTQLSVQYTGSGNTAPLLTYAAQTAGVYYVGIAGYYNTGYDPTKSGSGTASYTGSYTLQLTRLGAADSHLTGITALATSGTPATSGVASANVGQTITLTGKGLLSADQVVFTTIDTSGNLSTQTVSAASVAADGSSLTVIVPTNATTGMVRLARDTAGIVLQVVPVLTALRVPTGGALTGSEMMLTGTGFAEGVTNVNFGSQTLTDPSRSTGPDVYYGYPNGTYTTNGAIDLTTPNGVPTGPISVTTPGGTSTLYPLAVTGISATATTGTPANTAQASANIGQAITITGTGLTAATDVVFQTIDSAGTRGQIIVQPALVAADGSSATVVVPANATTGLVQVLGDRNNTKVQLQIVPVISGIYVGSVASDGSSAQVWLSGTGFAEDNNSTYSFGSTTIVDGSVNAGPDVSSNGYAPSGQYQYNTQANGFVSLTVPLSVAAFGSISVTTTGGSTAVFATTLASVTGTALSGTAANVALASANAGQAVTLTGTGLSTNTSVFFTYTSGSGTPTTVLLHPSAAALSGASATLIVPQYANGIATLSVLGAATQLSLQIVPVLNSAVEYGTDALQIEGSGFVLSSTSLQFGSVAQAAATAGEQNSSYNYATGQYNYTDNNQFNITTEATHGFGTLTVTTAGGTSAGLVLNQAQAGDGYLHDVAAASSGSQAWVADNYNPEILHLIDTTTGAQIRSLTLTGNLAYPVYGMGLQVTTAAFTLGATSVPAGSLLVFNANQNVIGALNATTGAVITSLSLPATYQPWAGVFDPTSGHLFIVDGYAFPSRIVELNPTTGALISSFNLPVKQDEAGLALDASGNLWFATGSSVAYELSRTGTVLRQVSLSDQGFIGNVTGLAFDAAGNLLVSSDRGTLTRISLSYDPAQLLPTLTSVAALATDGTPASSGTASANAGQVITLSGTNFNAGTEVVFQTLDTLGNAGTQAVNPLVVSADGKTLQVQVPLLATTGTIQVVNTGSSAALALQIVPTLSGKTGSPGGDSTFTLQGSGLMDGATTVTIGGVTLGDAGFTNQSALGVVNGSNNASLNVTAPLTLDGPITVKTAGGTATLAASWPSQPPVLFSAITATVQAGTATNGALASANVGQSITLVGQGFTNSTLVQFTAVDATGTVGTVTRTGTASSDGTSLVIIVPELAKTGLVHVLGSTASYTLQIVPVLRAVGGTIAAGNTIELDATGLVASELVITIDGKPVGTFAVHNEVDASTSSAAQQLLTLTVPSGIGAGVITLSTLGGSITLHTGVSLATSTQTPASDVGDTIATALAVNPASDSAVTLSATIGDGSNTTKDVDLYQVTLAAGEQLQAVLNATTSLNLRLFNAAGTQLSVQYTGSGNTAPLLTYAAQTAGIYYVGIAGYYNTGYDPTKSGSGTASYTGSYTLQLTRLGAADSHLTGITALATSGTPATSGVASANVGQTITLTGKGLLSADQVVFTTIDTSGNLSTQTVSAASVAADGSSLTVIVPTNATAGMVRLARDTAGIVLQVVPVLTALSVPTGGVLTGSQMTLTGTGFAEGVTNVNFGSQTLTDPSRSTGPDVYYGYPNGTYTTNGAIYLTTPNGVPTGPISVTTPGGTSAPEGGTAVTGVTSTATKGTPTNISLASANTGQAITITGAGLSTSTLVVFQTAGNSQVVVQPTAAVAGGTSATVTVPSGAVTGYVRVVGDKNGAEITLQIV